MKDKYQKRAIGEILRIEDEDRNKIHMKEIVFGTTNPGKITHVQAALEPFGMKVIPITDLGDFEDIVEDGKNPQENSRKKALAYCELVGRPVLAMDNALYFDGISDDKQPGMHVRRIPGIKGRATDQEMIEYYRALFESHGGEMTGHFEFSMCLVFPSGETHEKTAISKNRLFTHKLCKKRIPGYPLESMQIDPDTGKYIAEMSKEEQDLFWQESISKELRYIFDLN